MMRPISEKMLLKFVDTKPGVDATVVVEIPRVFEQAFYDMLGGAYGAQETPDASCPDYRFTTEQCQQFTTWVEQPLSVVRELAALPLSERIHRIYHDTMPQQQGREGNQSWAKQPR